MVLEDWDLKNCLREVDPELESVTSCIEVSFSDDLDGEEDHTSDGVDPDTDMFSIIKDVEEEDTSCYENLVEDLSMSDDDDEKDSGINEEIGESLTEDNSICVLLREKTPKDYSQVKDKSKRRCYNAVESFQCITVPIKHQIWGRSFLSRESRLG